MAIMEAMPLPERSFGRELRIQQTVGHIKEPGSHGQRGGKPWRKPQARRTPKGPAPQCGHRGRIQAQEVPVPQERVRKAQQILV